MKLEDIENIVWSKKVYKEFLNYLVSLEDIKYKNFHSSLTNTKYEIIGVRVPILRIIHKKIMKTNIEKFLSLVGDKYYEEVFIEGLVISSLNEDVIEKYLVRYINKIDNWAICDSFCSNLKIVNKKQGKYWVYFTSLLDPSKEFQTRVSLIIMLNYYLNDNYIDRVLKIASSIRSDYYYINMAISWLLSVAIINYREKVISLLKNKCLSKFVQNKTISKIQDSYRIDKELKEYVKQYRI